MAINTQSILSTLETKIASMDSNTPLDDMIVNIKSYQEAGGVVSIQYDSSGAMPILDSAQAGLVLYSASDTALYAFNGNAWAAVGNAAAGDAGPVGWIADVANFSDASETFSVASQETTPRDVVFNADGTKMYIVGQSADSILQYSLSTAFDVSTASYDSVSYNPNGTNQHALRFNSDGTKFYNLSAPVLYQYSMSTAYDISTASYDSVSFDFTSTSSSPYAFDISPDGTKLVAVSFIDDAVTQYTMSTAFDLSTLSYDSISLDISSNSANCFGISWSADGGALYLNDAPGSSGAPAKVVQYLCSTPFDLSTATYDDYFDFTNMTGHDTSGVVFNADGSKLYLVSSGADIVYTFLTGL